MGETRDGCRPMRERRGAKTNETRDEEDTSVDDDGGSMSCVDGVSWWCARSRVVVGWSRGGCASMVSSCRWGRRQHRGSRRRAQQDRRDATRRRHRSIERIRIRMVAWLRARAREQHVCNNDERHVASRLWHTRRFPPASLPARASSSTHLARLVRATIVVGARATMGMG